MTMDCKMAGDLVYVIGNTRNELGGSEYYEHLGYTGLNVPRVVVPEFIKSYKALGRVIEQELAASVHGIYRGGLGVHLAMVAMGGNLGMDVDISLVPAEEALRSDILLFSESAGRFIVTVDPLKKAEFEKIFSGLACACIGRVTGGPDFVIRNSARRMLLSVSVADLKTAWKQPFGDLI